MDSRSPAFAEDKLRGNDEAGRDFQESRKRRGISQWVENTQREIPRSARNDTENEVLTQALQPPPGLDHTSGNGTCSSFGGCTRKAPAYGLSVAAPAGPDLKRFQ